MLSIQHGGMLSPDKVWEIYGERLTVRLVKDRTYTNTDIDFPVIFSGLSRKYQKYLEWIVTSYLDGGIRYFEDIPSGVYPALKAREKLLRKKILVGVEANILNYCGLIGCEGIRKGVKISKPGLDALLDDHQEELDSMEENETSKYVPDPSTLFYDGNDIKIYKLTSTDDACYYGRGTKWCTAAKKHNAYDGYARDNILYVVVPKKPKYKGEKYQIAISHSEGFMTQAMNEKDEFDNVVDKYPETLVITPKVMYGIDPHVLTYGEEQFIAVKSGGYYDGYDRYAYLVGDVEIALASVVLKSIYGDWTVIVHKGKVSDVIPVIVHPDINMTGDGFFSHTKEALDAMIEACITSSQVVFEKAILPFDVFELLVTDRPDQMLHAITVRLSREKGDIPWRMYLTIFQTLFHASVPQCHEVEKILSIIHKLPNDTERAVKIKLEKFLLSACPDPEQLAGEAYIDPLPLGLEKLCTRDLSSSEGGMNVSDIKIALRRAGLSDIGLRPVLRKRLCLHYGQPLGLPVTKPV
jgi:hypothetical protein